MRLLSALAISCTPALGFMVIGLFWGSFAAAVPDIKAGLGATDQTFGLILLANAIGLVTAMSLAPRFDRWAGAQGLRVSVLLLASVMLLPFLAGNLVLFGLAMVAMGLGSGMLDILVNTRVSELEQRHARALMNANHGMFSVAYALGAFTTGQFRELELPLTWVIGGIILVIMILSIFMQAKPDFGEENGAGSGALGTLVIVCGAIVLIAFMAEATVETWSALHIERTLNGGAAEGALGPTMLGLTMAFGRFSGQALSDRLSQFAILIGATTLTAMGCVLAATAPTPFWAYFGFGVLGLGVSVIGPIGLAMVGQVVSPAQRSAAIAKASIIGFSGFFVAPALMGVLSEAFGLRWAYASVALLVVMLFPLIAVMARRS